jgi:PAS domain S-box-containing protein
MSRYLHESGEFQIIATNETGQEFVGMRVQPQTQDEERSFAMLSSESLIFDNSDPAQSELNSPIVEAIGTQCGVTVVITGPTDVFGVLAVHSKTKRAFSGDDVTFLQSVANVLSATIVRNRISTELVDRERSLNAVLDNAADGIVVADQLGNIVMANNAAEDIFGYDADKLRMIPLRDLVPISYSTDQAHTAHDPQMQLSAREMVGRRRDGTTVPIDIAMSEFDGPEGAMHIALVRDISEQKSLQSQLIQASKLATVGKMAAGIAHELNQPLNIMRMAADNVLIRMEAGSADLEYARDNLALVSEQAGRMGKIILHMRVFSRQDKSDFVTFDPTRPVRNASELMRRQLQLQSIELNVDAQVPDLFVKGSESQLEQVVINMITNARDAILEQTKGEDFTGSRGKIDVLSESDPNGSVFRVRVLDTGDGIPEDVIAKVFDPFFTTKEVGVGTGLGLSVSYGIISSMGGSITARNTESGCQMSVELPLANDLDERDISAKIQAPTLQ